MFGKKNSTKESQKAKKNDEKNLPKLPENLPYGEGSFDYVIRAGITYVRYRKTVNGKRVAVFGEDVKTCYKKMRDKEKKVKKGVIKNNEGSTTFLNYAIDFLENSKIDSVKKSAWDREYHTLMNQIAKYEISNIQMQAIQTKDIQSHLHTLIDEGYSYSTLAKTYDLINQVMAYYYKKNVNNNPMICVNKPLKKNFEETSKEPIYLDEEDLFKFVAEATRRYGSGVTIYRYGPALCAMIFSLLRVGEALALTWENIDFENGILYVDNNIVKVINDRIKKDGDMHGYERIMISPKNGQKREVYLSEPAINFLKLQKSINNPKSEKEFVFVTKNGSLVNERNLRHTLNRIVKAACLSVSNIGFHCLRHTGISLYCRAGVPKETVAANCGHKDTQLIDRIYRHVSKHERIEATIAAHSLVMKHFVEMDIFKI